MFYLFAFIFINAIIALDNRFAGTFVPASLDDGAKDWVKLRIGVDVYTAKGIVKFARKNYDYYNPEAKSWFSNL